MMKQTFNTISLFHMLYDGQQDGFLNIWAKHDKSSISKWFALESSTAADQALDCALKLDTDGYDVYFNVCTSAVSKGLSSRCGKGDILRIPAYFLDVDTLEDTGKGNKRIPATPDNALEMLGRLSCPPTVCVRSGHGLHAYWLLDKPINVSGDYKSADARLKRFAKAVAASIDCQDLDTHASEVCRVLRVPETHNRKRGGELPVKLEPGSGVLYSADKLDGFAKAIESTKTAGDESAVETSTAAGGAPVDAVQPRNTDYQPGGRYYLTNAQIFDAIKRSRSFKDCTALINGNTSAFPSASEADLRLCDAFAFFVGGDAMRVDDLYRQTLLCREKWDERHGAKTYGEITIEKACRDTTKFFRGSDYKLDSLTEEQKNRFDAVAAAYERASGGSYIAAPYMIQAAKTDRNGNKTLETLADFVPEPLETLLRDDGAECQREYVFSGWNYAGKRLPRVAVPASKLKSFNWVTENWAGAVIEAGSQKADKLRAAVQKAERELAKRRTVYTHSGWRDIGGKYVYLFNGGAVGVDGLSVELGGKLAHYALPLSGADADATKSAVRESLRLLDLAPYNATAPLLISMYLAPLCQFFELAGERVSHLTIVRGKTQSKKSTLTALMLSHFGTDFTYNSLPLNFQSTANAICAQLFQLKDLPAVVDDFHPTGAEKRGSLDEMTRTARRISRAVADDAGRARMESDGRTIQADRPARGLVIMTAEFEPDLGESGDSRCFIVPLNKGDVKPGEELDNAQEKARKGVYAKAMRGFIEYLCRKVNVHSGEQPFAEQLRTLFIDHRRELLKIDLDFAVHGRLGTAGAHMLTALDIMLEYARACGTVDAQEILQIADKCRSAIINDLASHATDIQATDPVRLFITSLDELAGSSHALIPIGGIADDDFCGYQTDEMLYLVSSVTVGRIRRLCRDAGTSLGVSGKELWRRLDEAGAVQHGNSGGKGTPARTQHIPGLKKSFYCVALYRKKLEQLRMETNTGDEKYV